MLWQVLLNKSTAKLTKRPRVIFAQSVGAGALIAAAVFLSAWVGLATGDATLAAIAFSLGLLSVLYLKLELYTGNCLLIAPVIENRKSGWQRPLGSLCCSILGNAWGSVGMSLVLQLCWPDAALSEKLMTSAIHKLNLPWHEVIFRGWLCNIFVSGAVLAFWWAKRHTVKIALVACLVAAFILAGGEHVVANFAYGLIAVKGNQPIQWLNLPAAAIGNFLGGAFVVGVARVGLAEKAS